MTEADLPKLEAQLDEAENALFHVERWLEVYTVAAKKIRDLGFIMFPSQMSVIGYNGNGGSRTVVSDDLIYLIEEELAERNRKVEPRPEPPRIPKFIVGPGKKRRVLERDGYTCQYCLKKLDPADLMDLTIDHKTPSRRGGDSSMENLATACRGCNTSKGSRTVDEFAAWKVEKAALAAWKAERVALLASADRNITEVDR